MQFIAMDISTKVLILDSPLMQTIQFQNVSYYHRFLIKDGYEYNRSDIPVIYGT